MKLFNTAVNGQVKLLQYALVYSSNIRQTLLLTGGKEVGVNPKINNMQPGYLAAKHDLVLISDSGLMMKEDTLSDMVSHMTPDVGIVHQMPFCCDRKGWPAILEKVRVATRMVIHKEMYCTFVRNSLLQS